MVAPEPQGTLGVSAHFLKPGRVGGAEFMLKNLVDGLNLARDASHHALRIFSDFRWPVHGPQGRLEWVPTAAGANRFIREWKQLREATELEAVLLPNYFTPPFLGRNRCRQVTVIHDLNYRHHPHTFSRTKRLWLRIAHAATLRSADAVVVISDFVKNDLIAQYGSAWEHKIRVVPNPVSFERFTHSEGGVADELPTLPDRFLLTVAAHYPHKNLHTLIRAFARLGRDRRFSDVKLILVGQLGRNLVGTARVLDMDALIDELDIREKVMLTGHVSDTELGLLYRRASIFALPSLFEGFGMPAAEALGFGLPVITTKCGALPEVTLNAAHYVEDPLDASEWTSVLGEALTTPARFKPSQSVVDQVRHRYSPKRVGRLYYDLLVGT